MVDARKVFFSFHFKRDAWRAGQVRNSDMLADEDEYGVIDSVEWEKIEKAGDEAIKRWILDQLKYTSVTVVLIGAETSEREWVEFEIRESWKRGNALVGVRIHGIKNQDSQTDMPGSNPLDLIKFRDGAPLSSIFKTYDWNLNNGRENLGKWVEEAFQIKAAMKETKELAASLATSATNTPQFTSNAGPTVISNPSKPWGL